MQGERSNRGGVKHVYIPVAVTRLFALRITDTLGLIEEKIVNYLLNVYMEPGLEDFLRSLQSVCSRNIICSQWR